ncbi:hypothetical protein SLEP1_g57341 [Rubroshorea leprosula]|uniref:Uncharacterized protein n=1 Tax=Rubroshorea leprosula TaxID=152421 RepID=A0AAV5MM59_9ROSI|nr:hypothetical protein SLEP1_g57341 [Rubroshorea leprosula]
MDKIVIKLEAKCYSFFLSYTYFHCFLMIIISPIQN